MSAKVPIYVPRKHICLNCDHWEETTKGILGKCGIHLEDREATQTCGCCDLGLEEKIVKGASIRTAIGEHIGKKNGESFIDEMYWLLSCEPWVRLSDVQPLEKEAKRLRELIQLLPEQCAFCSGDFITCGGDVALAKEHKCPKASSGLVIAIEKEKT